MKVLVICILIGLVAVSHARTIRTGDWDEYERGPAQADQYEHGYEWHRRGEQHACDLSDYCSGSSPFCPSDAYPYRHSNQDKYVKQVRRHAAPDAKRQSGSGGQEGIEGVKGREDAKGISGHSDWNDRSEHVTVCRSSRGMCDVEEDPVPIPDELRVCRPETGVKCDETPVPPKVDDDKKKEAPPTDALVTVVKSIVYFVGEVIKLTVIAVQATVVFTVWAFVAAGVVLASTVLSPLGVFAIVLVILYQILMFIGNAIINSMKIFAEPALLLFRHIASAICAANGARLTTLRSQEPIRTQQTNAARRQEEPKPASAESTPTKTRKESKPSSAESTPAKTCEEPATPNTEVADESNSDDESSNSLPHLEETPEERRARIQGLINNWKH